jgi:predicted nuclease with TOPRIM domain
MQLRSELQANIASIKLQIEEQKQQAKDFVDDESSVKAVEQRLSELHVRLAELEQNLKKLDQPNSR